MKTIKEYMIENHLELVSNHCKTVGNEFNQTLFDEIIKQHWKLSSVAILELYIKKSNI